MGSVPPRISSILRVSPPPVICDIGVGGVEWRAVCSSSLELHARRWRPCEFQPVPSKLFTTCSLSHTARRMSCTDDDSHGCSMHHTITEPDMPPYNLTHRTCDFGHRGFKHVGDRGFPCIWKSSNRCVVEGLIDSCQATSADVLISFLHPLCISMCRRHVRDRSRKPQAVCL